MDTCIRRVIIVGGGSAGWITAARMAARWHDDTEGALSVTLIESPGIETIGVGEGTWPTMRNTLRKAGVTETNFLRSCDAAFKQGAKFVRWTDGTGCDGYYHPLNPPQGAPGINLSPHWDRLQRQGSPAFADCVDFQSALCEAGIAPKAITTPEYVAVANYAYHLDALYAEASAAQRCFEVADRARKKLLGELPRHRDLLSKVRDFGFQTV